MLREHGALLAEVRELVVRVPGYSADNHDDLHLLRFLLSHKLRPAMAAKAFANACAWRAAHGIDDISAAIRAGLEQPGFPLCEVISARFPALGAAFICNVSPALKMLWDTALTRLLPKRVLDKAFVLMPLASAKDRERLAQWIPEDHLPAAVGGKVELGHAV